MKAILTIACMFITLVSFSQEDVSKIDWLTNLDNAKKISAKKDKPILIYFTGSDWCAPCVGLKKDFFNSPDFEEYTNEFVMVMIDYPRRMDIISDEQRAYNKTIIEKYNSSNSFPKLTVVNSKGKELGNISGYSSYNTYQDTSHHLAFVKKHRKE